MDTIKHTVDKTGTHAILAQTDKRKYHGIGVSKKAAEKSVAEQARMVRDRT